ncbi:hypothetical protein Vadar_001552 [Vaccinium darrowii]|uniref:Uncharacterized protein n=1 Tax=Vaccinium darrowii TaxID=229202 RepID=A0ACB7Z9V7_9ERIC|nr:hypothetical protein Vadar_001552 [Vaccinium darrowii]
MVRAKKKAVTPKNTPTLSSLRAALRCFGAMDLAAKIEADANTTIRQSKWKMRGLTVRYWMAISIAPVKQKARTSVGKSKLF